MGELKEDDRVKLNELGQKYCPQSIWDKVFSVLHARGALCSVIMEDPPLVGMWGMTLLASHLEKISEQDEKVAQ